MLHASRVWPRLLVEYVITDKLAQGDGCKWGGIKAENVTNRGIDCPRTRVRERCSVDNGRDAIEVQALALSEGAGDRGGAGVGGNDEHRLARWLSKVEGLGFLENATSTVESDGYVRSLRF